MNAGKQDRRDEIRSALRRHVIDAWFPRCLDPDYGGFLCDFDHRWDPVGPHDKLLEFQARQTWLAAELFKQMPWDQGLRDAAAEGLRTLRDRMWDHEHGGWFHRLDRTCSERLEAGTKHAHGMAYAINACASVFGAMGEADALQMAREGFEWLERFAHDAQHGGYFGFLERNGTIIRDWSANPLGLPTDTIGTQVGLKDINVHCDLVETFTNLYRVWPAAKVAIRLRELVDVIEKGFVRQSGALFPYVQSDFTPVPHIVDYGFLFQTADRLLAALDVIGQDEKTTNTARGLVHCGLRFAWDRRSGGVFTGGPGAFPLVLEGHSLILSRKVWWVQFEALLVLAKLQHAPRAIPAYQEVFDRIWTYTKANMLDAEHGGVLGVGSDCLAAGQERTQAPQRKSSIWKDGSHEGRTLLYCSSLDQ